MIEFTQYFGRAQAFGGRLTGLPPWARTIVAIFAIPGVILTVLSLLMFLVSILALLILTAPVYSLLRTITQSSAIPVQNVPESAGVKRVESTIVE